MFVVNSGCVEFVIAVCFAFVWFVTCYGLVDAAEFGVLWLVWFCC